MKTENEKGLILMWGKDGSGHMLRRGSTWADSWMEITDFLEEKVEKGSPDRSHNTCECMKKIKERHVFWQSRE